MSNLVKYTEVDTSRAIGAVTFRCPHHARHTFTFDPGVRGASIKGECGCSVVPRQLRDGKILMMVIQQEGESTLRRFMTRFNGNT
jgi:hypothetical protein